MHCVPDVSMLGIIELSTALLNLHSNIFKSILFYKLIDPQLKIPHKMVNII